MREALHRGNSCRGRGHRLLLPAWLSCRENQRRVYSAQSGQVYAALSYYHERKDEIDASIQAKEGTTEKLESQWQEYAERHGGQPPEDPAPEDRHIARPVDWPRKA